VIQVTMEIFGFSRSAMSTETMAFIPATAARTKRTARSHQIGCQLNQHLWPAAAQQLLHRETIGGELGDTHAAPRLGAVLRGDPTPLTARLRQKPVVKS